MPGSGGDGGVSWRWILDFLINKKKPSECAAMMNGTFQAAELPVEEESVERVRVWLDHFNFMLFYFSHFSVNASTNHE